MLPKLYLYAIINSPECNTLSSEGVTGFKPYYINFKDISIIASICSNEEIKVNFENLSKHDQVICELLNSYCVLPIPIKNIVASESHVIDFATKKYEQIKINFQKLENKFEMGIKIAWDIDKVKYTIKNDGETSNIMINADTPAKAFLQKKMVSYNYQNRLLEKAELIKNNILKELDGTFSDSRVSLLDSEKIPFNGAFLIEKTKKNQFVDIVKRHKLSNKELSFLLSGPWAPYNFTKID